MRGLLVVVLIGCGRISFELDERDEPDGGSSVDGPARDGAVGDSIPADGSQVRACHTDARYVASPGLANTYREGVSLVSWSQARLDCMVDGADLWVVESAVEQAAFDGDWTGITDEANENVWRKLDGTIATFLPFITGQPDGGDDESCIRTSSNGFEDRECTDQRDYVCECPAP